MNYIKNIAELLGVEIGEKFVVYDNTYKIDSMVVFKDDGLYLVDNNIKANHILGCIVSGELQIEKLPWKPKDGDTFYYIDGGGITFPVIYDIDRLTCRLLFKIGNFYRTPKEAEKYKDKWVEFFKSDEVIDVGVNDVER